MNKLRFVRKPWFVVLMCLLALMLASNLPIIPVGRTQRGKESFILRVETKELLYSLDYQIEKLPSIFNYLSIQTIERSQIIFEGNDWILDVNLQPKKIATINQHVTYYNPPMERVETWVVGLYVEIDISYTDKKSGIQSTFKRVLVSEATSGEFDFNEYLEYAEENIPLIDFRFSFGQIEIVNKETSVSIADLEYDPGLESYIRHIIAEISYDFYYSTTLSSSESAISVMLSNLDITFTNQIFSAMVAFLIAYYQIKSRSGDVSMLKTKLLEQEKKSTQVSSLPPPPLLLCPTCGKPATWIPNYQRFYCYICKKYVKEPPPPT